MSKILKNDSGNTVVISDTGVSINNATEYTIPPQDYLLWAASDNIVTEVGGGSIVVNDGSNDLSISDGIDLIKGIFPTTIDINSSNSSPLITKDNNMDSFGRTRVSDINTIFDYNFSNVVDFDLYWSTTVENGASVTHLPDDASYELNASTTIGSRVILQSRRHMEYYSGKSHIGYFTGNPRSIKQGMRKRLGLFTSSNGYFLEITDTGPRIVVRKNGVDDAIEYDDWNGDKVDGNGPSGYVSDLTKQKLYFIDVAWLGAGGVRFGQVIDGKNIIMHEYRAANLISTPFTQTAVLPFRVEIECIATAPESDNLALTCFAYLYEGNRSKSEKIRNWNSGTSSITVNTTPTSLFGVRINSLYGESSIILNEANLTLVSGNSEVRWRLLYNPTITSATWTDQQYSVAQTLSNPTATTYSGGFVAASGYLNVGDTGKIDLTRTDIVLGHDTADVFDTFILEVRTLSSNSKILTEVDWGEFN